MRPSRLGLGAVLLAAALLRFSGLDWSVDAGTGTFHRFHPDEATVLDNAAFLDTDPSRIKSAYGLAPVYLLYAAGHISGLILDFDAFDWDDPRAERLTFLTARALNALLGTATVFLVFLLGHRAGGSPLGIVAALLLAFSPGHIQQCHYYTVDAGLTFWTTLALYLILLLPAQQWWKHVLVGFAVGLAGGYRFIAALLAVPYLVAHLWRPEDRSRPDRLSDLIPRLRRIVSLNTLLCGFIALTVTLTAYPTLVRDPDTFFAPGDQRDFLQSVEVATGQTLRLWNLYDLTTTPYLFYITDLFPAALGTFAACGALIGLVLCFVRPARIPSLLLTFALAYFALTGGLFTKPIRYTAPILPIACILAAYAWHLGFRELGRKRSVPIGVVLAALLVVPTAAHGIAVSRVYTSENVRFEARRWALQNLPAATTFIGETGGFPTLWMIESERRHSRDPGSLFMRTRHQVLDANVLDILDETAGHVDAWILIPQNRAIPYTSAPDRFPVAAEFYARLRDGRIGYRLIKRFTRPAHLFGFTFDRDDTDPTITAFDRPTIEIYERTPDYERLWSAWRDDILTDPDKPDAMIREGVTHFRAGDFAAARTTFEKARQRFPENKLAELCWIEAIYRLESSETAQRAFEEARINQWAFVGLTLAGIPERGAEYILITQEGKPATTENLYIRQVAAKAFASLGHDAQRGGNKDRAIAYYEKAISMSRAFLHPYQNLGHLYLEEGQFARSRDAYREAIRIRSGIADLWIGLSIAETYLGAPEPAYRGALEAIRLAPREPRYHPILRQIADFLERSGQPEWAADILAKL